MEKRFFDWAKDPDLNESSKLINMPASAEQKFADLEDGYHMSEKGMLEKEFTIDIPKRYEDIEYDPKNIQLDQKGRSYFLDKDKRRMYVDNLNNIYHLSINEFGSEEEYIETQNGPLFFKNSEHTLATDLQGKVYIYSPQKRSYIYEANIVLFPKENLKR